MKFYFCVIFLTSHLYLVNCGVLSKRNIAKKSAIALKTEPAEARNGRWTQLNHFHPVCFEGQGNRFGHLIHVGKKGLIGAIKLVYRTGSIRCVANPAYDSRWGCYHYSTFMKYPLNVIITDNHNNILYPQPQYIKHTAGLWYYLPMVDDKHSNELVFTDFSQPFYIQGHQQLRIWYGEDLKNWSETDNQGRVCVNVFARFL
ncbi:uncharacterized protein LOC116303544 [Actinia tenebrosa]|uniref:Uncharacterized protein LOC116303544 n=1 Tax=Actinia tenebrosa TaxID=6105 RepID=A0A6P8IRG3_ACTTE|nr:uncharacterized protein LOC116303544 [Actinia tenebrosa]